MIGRRCWRSTGSRRAPGELVHAVQQLQRSPSVVASKWESGAQTSLGLGRTPFKFYVREHSAFETASNQLEAVPFANRGTGLTHVTKREDGGPRQGDAIGSTRVRPGAASLRYQAKRRCIG